MLKAHLYFCLLYSYSNYQITQLNLRLSLGRNQIGSVRQSPFMSIVLTFESRYINQLDYGMGLIAEVA